MFNPEMWFTEYNNQNIEDRTLSQSFKIKKHLVKDRSEFQTLDIIDTYEYGKILLLDGLVMITEKDEFVYHDMIVHVPVNLLKYNGVSPKKALVIGGGDGGTVRELLKYDSIEDIELCEIDGLVVDYSKEYFPEVAIGLSDPRVKVIIGDGIKYMQQKTNEYDIICVDSTDPIGPAVGLFNEDFYKNVKKALTENGVVTAQQESYIYHSDFLVKMNDMLAKVFDKVNYYRADISTYPSGTWCFQLSSKKFDPLSCYNSDFTKEVTFKSKYYNASMHRGAFALPTYLEELLNKNK